VGRRPFKNKKKFEKIFIGRQMIGPVTAAVMEAHSKALAPLGLSAREAMVIANCAWGEANTPGALAWFSGLDVSTMTRMLDRLEAKGLIKRSRGGDDRRKVFVRLTSRGLARFRKGLPIAAAIARTAWRGVTKQEIRGLRKVFNKILRNLGHEGKL